MTTVRAGLSDQEIAALEKQVDALKTLPPQEQFRQLAEIEKQMDKMTDAQYEAFNLKQMEKMTPEERAQAQQMQQQLMKVPPAQVLQSYVLQSLQNVFKKAAQDPDISLADTINVAQTAAQAAQGYAALQTAMVEAAKLAAAQQQMPRPLPAAGKDGPGHGQYL